MEGSKKGEFFLKAAIVVSVMLLIYAFSAQPSVESEALSNQFYTVYRQVIIRLDFLPDDIRHELMHRPSYYIRKCAHLMIYALLGMVTVQVLWQTTIREGLCALIAFILCTVYAVTDEWHQYYVEGRGAQLSDVLLDSMGALIGILCLVVVRYLIRKIRKDE